MFSVQPISRRALTILISVSAASVLLSGCGVTPLAASGGETAALGTISGKLHGGQQPINGSTVTLFAFGTTGYGIGAGARGTATTDSNGSFSFASGTNACASGETLYVVATGGDPGVGAPNPAISMMSVLGSCTASKSAYVFIDEVSTVAAMYSLAQYFSPTTESFGSGTSTTGITNALNTVNLLANLTTGQAVTSTTTGTTTAVTITPEYAKVNTIANILAACINSANTSGTASPQCSTLFSNAVPPPNGAVTGRGAGATFPTATDTLLAAYYLVVNPTNSSTLGVASPARTSALAALSSAIAPFQPSSTSAPTDWTVAINYSSNSQLGTSPNNYYVMSATTNPSIDSAGAIAYSNQPVSQNQTWAKLTAAGVYSNSAPSTPSTYSPMSPALAVDSQNHIFYAPGVGSGTGNGVFATGVTTNVVPKNASAYLKVAGIAIDGATSGTAPIDNNILFTDVTNNNVSEIPAGTASNTNFSVTAINSSPLSLAGAGPNGIAIDQTGHVWVAETGTTAIARLTYPAANAPVVVSSASAFRAPYALAIDHSNNVWVANAVGTTDNGFLTYVVASGPTVVADTTASDAGVNNPVSIAVDGAGNAWVANAGQTVNGTANTGQTVSELAYVSGSIVPLSPSGATGGFTHAYNGVSGIAVDLSGNVWITNSAAVASGTAGGLLTEIVGAAVPTVVSLSTAIKAGTLATKP